MNDKKNIFGTALTKCFWCGSNDKIVINKLLTERMAEKVEEMNGKCIDKEPCQKCQDIMKEGVILVAYDEEKSPDMTNPYRTGGWFAVKPEALERFQEILDDNGKKAVGHMIEMRVGFMPEEICRNVLGLYDAIPTKTIE